MFQKHVSEKMWKGDETETEFQEMKSCYGEKLLE